MASPKVQIELPRDGPAENRPPPLDLRHASLSVAPAQQRTTPGIIIINITTAETWNRSRLATPSQRASGYKQLIRVPPRPFLGEEFQGEDTLKTN